MEIVLYSSDQSLSNTSSQSSYCNQWPLGMLLVRCYFSESSIIQYIIFNDPAWNEAYTCNPRQEEKRGHVRLCTLVSPTSGVEIVPATLSFLLMMALWFHQQRLTDQHYQHYTEKRTKSIPCFVSGLLSAPGALLLLTMCKFHKLHFTTSCFLAALARKGKTTPKKLLQYNREDPSSSLWFTCSKLSINSALPFSWWTVQNRVYLHSQDWKHLFNVYDPNITVGISNEFQDLSKLKTEVTQGAVEETGRHYIHIMQIATCKQAQQNRETSCSYY